MNLADLLLLAIVGLGFAVGFLRGTVRALLAVGAWAVCFLIAAYLRVPLGELAGHQWARSTPSTPRCSLSVPSSSHC